MNIKKKYSNLVEFVKVFDKFKDADNLVDISENDMQILTDFVNALMTQNEQTIRFEINVEKHVNDNNDRVWNLNYKSIYNIYSSEALFNAVNNKFKSKYSNQISFSMSKQKPFLYDAQYDEWSKNPYYNAVHLNVMYDSKTKTYGDHLDFHNGEWEGLDPNSNLNNSGVAEILSVANEYGECKYSNMGSLDSTFADQVNYSATLFVELTVDEVQNLLKQ